MNALLFDTLRLSRILRDKGHVGFQSHDNRVEFKNIYLKPL